MPNIPVVTAQGSVQIGAPDAYASPDTFGAGIGRALQGVGEEIGRAARVSAFLSDKHEDEEAANLVANADYTKRNLDRRSAAQPGADGFYEETRTDYPNWVDEYTRDIQNPNVRKTVKATLMRRAPTVLASDAAFQAQSADARSRSEANSGLSAVLNKIRSDPNAYDTALEDGTVVIDTRPGIAEGDKALMRQKFRQDAVAARFDARIGAASTGEQLDAVEKEMKEPKWRDQFGANEFDKKLNELDTARTSIVSGKRAEATSIVEGLTSRSNDPSMPIPQQDIADAEKIVAESGSPTLMRRFFSIVAKQEVYRTEAKLPPYVLQSKREASARPVEKSSPTEDQAMQRIQAAGFSSVQAAGVVGHFASESGLNPNAVNRGDGTDGSDSIGIGQWNGPRAVALKAFAKSRGKSWNDLDTQIDFAIHEMQTTEQAAGTSLRAAQTAEDAAAAFVGYERPQGWTKENPTGAHNYAGRLANAKRLAGSTGGATLGEYVRNQARDDVEAMQRKAFAKDGDMMTYANNVGTVQLSSLDDQEAFVLRGQQATKVAEYNGVTDANATPLTKSEVAQLTRTAQDGSADEQLTLTENLMAMGPKMARAALRQIGQTDKVFEYSAGLSMAGDTDAAAAVIRGRKRLADNPSLSAAINPDRAGIAFDETTGGALFALKPEWRQAIRDAAMAHYAETFVARGANRTAAIDTTAYNSSVQAVLGGRKDAPRLDYINGAQTVLPKGVNAGTFESALDNMQPQDYARLSADRLPPLYPDGTPVLPDEIARDGHFMARGNNRYFIEMNGGYLLTRPKVPGRPDEIYEFVADTSVIHDISKAEAGTQRDVWDNRFGGGR